MGKKNTELGWNAITETFSKIYPEQMNPLHYGSLIKWSVGGVDPLDGISVYDGGSYYHFVTYGLSELYDKVSDNPNISGYGMEFTLKLRKNQTSEEDIKGICNILQTIARFTFIDHEIFHVNDYLYTGQEDGMDVSRKSNITGFIVVLDPDALEIDTSHGKVQFLEFIGVTRDEIEAIYQKKITVLELYNLLGNDLTDFHRRSVL